MFVPFVVRQWDGAIQSPGDSGGLAEWLAALLERVQNSSKPWFEMPHASGPNHFKLGRTDLADGSTDIQMSCACPVCGGVAKSEANDTLLVSSETSAADEGTGSIAPGGSASGVINSGGDVDYFTISLTAGQTYLISLAGSGGTPLPDAYLQLLNSAGTVVLATDDDGGSGTNSLLTFTPTTSGTFLIAAAGYPGDGLTGGYTVDVRQMGSDSAGSTLASAQSISLGRTFGFLETTTDVDMFKVTLQAGTLYTFNLSGGADYNTNPNSVPTGELDTMMTIYDSAGNVVASNDDVNYPSDVSSTASFTPDAGGTYYIKVDAYPAQKGGFTLEVNSVDASTLDPLDSIDWGTQLSSTNVTVYFAPSGETYDGVTSLGWTQYEIDQAMAALQTWADVTNLTFTITTNAATATFKLVTTQSNQFLGYFNPPGTTNAGVGVFATNGTGWNSSGGLEQGGYGWITLVHEFGHGLGLAHPHDNGGTSTVMPGVSGPFDSFGVYDLNQGVYTTMSYNDGWQLHPNGASPSLSYGYQAGPGAFDIALVQQKYGADPNRNSGDTVYVLPTSNTAGTFWHTIWDTGGTDAIVHNGTVAARIDLTAATLDYSATGAGVISWVNGIFGGFTIAAGVVIENAAGGSGADVLIGNSAANVLTGNAGNDTLQGNGGTDKFVFAAGDGQDVITDLAAGETVEISGYTSAQSVTQSGSNVVVVLSTTDRITFHNTTVAAVQAALVFPDAPPPDQGNVITGTEGEDVLNGTIDVDTIYGLGGNDLLDGGGGDDTLVGGAGNDRYYVNSAGDVIVEGAGEGGGMVRASVSYTLAAGVYVGTMATTNGSSTAPINLTGNEFNQSMYGNAGSNVLAGGGGDDYFIGLGGSDTFIGGTGGDVFRVDDSGDVVVELAGEGGDTVRASVSYVLPEGAHVENLITTNGSSTAPINLTGNSFNNSIYGNAGANVLSGVAGDDYLVGLGGNDTLIGGLGKDAFSGGAGNDRFVFNAASESTVGAADRVLDFTTGDLIDLSAIDANGGLAADQAFAFVGSNAFTGTAGELRSSQNANGTWKVEGDVNGDGIADFAITVTSAAALTAGDFML